MQIITDAVLQKFREKYGENSYPDFALVPANMKDKILNPDLIEQSEDNNKEEDEGDDDFFRDESIGKAFTPEQINHTMERSGYQRKSVPLIFTDIVGEVILVSI